MQAPRALPQGATVEEMDEDEAHGGAGRHQHHVQEPDDDGNGNGGGNGGGAHVTGRVLWRLEPRDQSLGSRLRLTIAS